MTKKIALVTGANKGIGFEISKQLGTMGMTVLVGARSLEKAKHAADALQADQIDARPVAVDVTNAEDIAAIAKYIEAEFGKLDVLVNNAGGFFDQLGRTADTMRQSFEVNAIGPFILTEALLPLLKASPAARIVNQSSILASLGTLQTDDFLSHMLAPAYSSSKAALNAITLELSIRLKETNIKVNASHPGWVKTEMGGEQAPMEISEGAETAVYLATLPDDGPTGGFYHMQDRLPW